MQQYFTRKNIIVGFIAVIVLILLFVAYDNLVFRLKNTSPSLENIATSSVEIRYQFSQPVKSVDSATFEGNDISGDIGINGNIVTIPFNRSLNSGSSYKIVLKSIKSQWFNNEIDSVVREFTPKYIEFNKLSKEQQQANINASDSGQVNDKFIDKNSFPIFNDRWQVNATVVNSDKTVVLEVEFFEEIPDYDNGGAIKQVPNDIADKYRQEVLDDIKKRGGDPKKYTIIYKTNKYLYEKYNQSDNHEG